MPVIDAPPSPDYERSPSPDSEREDRSAPAKKARLTGNDIQKRQIDKLLANPDKEIKLPAGMAERLSGVRAPKEIIKSVAGSASAAGSGEFHVYKHSRRREAERIRHMEETNRQLEEQRAFAERQAARDAITDAKTAKNRAKRLKRKAGRKGGGDGEKPVTGGSKLAGGASAGSKHPGEDGNDGESTEPAKSKFGAPPVPAFPQPEDLANAPNAEVTISIVEDE